MTPGELDQLITIKRESLADDGMGGHDVTLSDVAVDLWAKARALSGKEFERYDQVNATAMVMFIIRNRTDLLQTDQIQWNGAAYNIRYIHPTSTRDLYLMIEAEKGVAT
jgi:SPP1 family predicted phage head-tail adaptor